MKNDIADILFKYTTGEATLEETNDALKEAEAGFNLEPGRNEITPDEMALTTVGDTPEEANGFGLLDTGTGSMEKPISFLSLSIWLLRKKLPTNEISGEAKTPG